MPATLPESPAFTEATNDVDEVLDAHAKRIAPEAHPAFDSKKIDPEGKLSFTQIIDKARQSGALPDALSDHRSTIPPEKKEKKEEKKPEEKNSEIAEPEVKKSGVTESESPTDEDAENEKIAKGIPTKEARDAWKHRNGQLRDAKKKIAEFEAKVKELESRPAQKNDAADQALQKELETIRARLDEKEKIVERLAVQETDAFRQKFTEPLSRINGELNDISKNFGIELDFQALSKLPMKDRDTAIAELVADLPEPRRNKFYALIEGRERLETERASAIENAGKTTAAERIAQREQQDRQRTESSVKHRQNVEAKFQEMLEKEIPYVLPKDAPEELKQRIEEIRQFATSTAYEDLDEASKATVMARAPIFPYLRAVVDQQNKTIAKLTARLEKLKEGTPKAGGDSTTRSQHTEDEPDADGVTPGDDMVTAVKKRVAAAKARGQL